MRARWTVLVASNAAGLAHKSRAFGNFDTLGDAEALAHRLTGRLAVGFTAVAIPFFPAATGRLAPTLPLPQHMLKDGA